MKQVALLIETSNAYARGLLRGIVAYIREHRPWSLYLAEHSRGDQPPSWLRGWRGDGIIARIETPAMAKALRPLKIPIVDVSAARLIPSLPWFETDDAAFAQAAFEHLRERGFKRFALLWRHPLQLVQVARGALSAGGRRRKAASAFITSRRAGFPATTSRTSNPWPVGCASFPSPSA